MRRCHGLSHVLEPRSKEAGKKRIQTKEKSSIWVRKSRGSWGSGDGDQQEENGIFFSSISESFLQFTDNTAFPWKSWNILWRLIAFQQWGALCMHQSSLVHKQAMDLLAHFSNPLTKPSMVAARLLPYHLAWEKSLSIMHQWSVGCSGAQSSRLEGEPQVHCPWICERSRWGPVRTADFCACRYNICLECTWHLNAQDWSCF